MLGKQFTDGEGLHQTEDFKYICERCQERRTEHRHHKFSQTKVNRKLYGSLIDHPKNIMYLCERCHTNEKELKYTEKQFCQELGITSRSKSGLL